MYQTVKQIFTNHRFGLCEYCFNLCGEVRIDIGRWMAQCTTQYTYKKYIFLVLKVIRVSTHSYFAQT